MEIISSENNNTIKSYIVFFDLDRTITKAISGKALAETAYRKKMMTRSGLVNAIIISLAHRFNLMDPRKLIDKMLRWIKGIPENSINTLCSEVFRNVLLPSVHPEVIPEIKFHKEKNAKVVILSSSLAAICSEMAAHIDIDDIICTHLEVTDGICTGKTTGPVCFGEEKVVRLKEYCEKNNMTLDKAWYYGDAVSDLPALTIVGNPVCINPERKLLRAARKNGWKIFYWK